MANRETIIEKLRQDPHYAFGLDPLKYKGDPEVRAAIIAAYSRARDMKNGVAAPVPVPVPTYPPLAKEHARHEISEPIRMQLAAPESKQEAQPKPAASVPAARVPRTRGYDSPFAPRSGVPKHLIVILVVCASYIAWYWVTH